MQAWATILNKFLDNINLGKLFSEVLPGMILTSAFLYIAQEIGILKGIPDQKAAAGILLPILKENVIFVIFLAIALGVINGQLSGAIIYGTVFKKIDKKLNRRMGRLKRSDIAGDESSTKLKSEIYYLTQYPDRIPHHVALIQDYYRYVELAMNLAIPIFFWAGTVFLTDLTMTFRIVVSICLIAIGVFVISNAYLSYDVYWARRMDFLTAMNDIHERNEKERGASRE